MKKYIVKNKELMKLWSENNVLDPTKIADRSSKKALWVCGLNHEWEAVISKVYYGHRCPYCSGKRVLEGFNDLTTVSPEILSYWDYEKNTIKPTEVTKGVHKVVWWKCELGHSWDKAVYVMTDKKTMQRCPYCSNHRVLQGFNDIATTHPHLLKKWDYAKNTKIQPTQVTFSSAKKVWWKCDLDHSWDASISKINVGRDCPYCSVPPRKILAGFNDLATKKPEVLQYWDYDKNEINPREIAPHSEKVVWWKCELGHSWDKKITKVAAGERCPFCAGKRILIGFNDLNTICSGIENIWRDDKDPSDFHNGSEKLVSVLCPVRNETFKKSARKVMSSYPFCSCDNCRRGISKFEREVNKFFLSLNIGTETSNRQIIKPYELDIVIKDRKIAIECNGSYWHSDEFIRKSKGVTAIEHHERKKQMSKESGYDLFFVWEDDWKQRKDKVKEELKNIVDGRFEKVELLNRLI